MAASTYPVPNSESSLEEATTAPPDLVKLKAAELYGLGHKRNEIARMMVYHLDKTPERPLESKLKYARSKLRNWEAQQEFRDLVWDRAVVELDMTTPQILKGVAQKAKRGRVDAAKLALSITGRHTDKDENRPGTININLGIIPRPDRQAMEKPADITVDYDE